MNIGIVTTWFERGAAYVSKQYKEVLEGQGNKVYIYARGGVYAKGDPVWDLPEVYWSKGKNYIDDKQTNDRELVNWAKSNKIDVVIFNEQVWLKNIVALKKSGIKVGAYIDYYTEPMLPTFEIYDFLLCNTKKHHSAFKDIHKNAFYLPWGTDIKLFDTSSQRQPSEKIRFFHSSGMSGYRKGTDLAIKAYLNMAEELREQSEFIIHAQRDPFLALNKDEKKKVKQLLTDGNITVIEKTVTAPGLFHLGDIYVYPSRLDGIGLSTAEALASGMPIIVPDDGPMNEFVCPNSQKVKVQKYFCRADAYYWPMNEVDITELTNAFEFYVANKDKIKKFSRIARKTAQDRFDFEKNMHNLSTLIESVELNSNISEELLDTIKNFTNKQWPYLYEFTGFYLLLLRLKKLFK